MAPKTKEQYDEQKQEKRELILSTALEVFATHGYHGASISTIAQHAGIAKGLMYTYFKSKEDLLKEILIQGVKELIIFFMPYIQKDVTPELFGKLLRQFFKQLRANTDFWRLYFSITMQPSVMELLEDEFSDLNTPYMNILEKYYAKQGSKNPQADAILAHALIDGIALNFVMTHQNFNMESVENIVIDHLTKPSY
jgi:AcrR family transcriptional regulator